MMALLPLLLLAAGPAQDPAPDYQREVRPILSDRCFACHGPDANARKAGLRLDERGAALAALGVGDGTHSEVLHRVRSIDEGERMPPPESKKPNLSADELDVLERWIAAGAPYSGHWSFEPLRAEPPPRPAPRSWGRNGLDDLILVRLAAAERIPSAPADRATLLRRVTLDLTGLPPTPEALAAFLADDGEGAYERAVEALFASPHHGERMAVWWLDLVRYGDSSGYHSDRPIPAWPYREWVIDAFQQNLPFDRFTEAQLAGDLLPDASDATRTAAVYNRLNKTTDEGGAQAGEYLVKSAADRVRTLSSVWLGLTMGCAECHDHKYDPLTQRDFYSLAAFFSDITQVGVYEHGGWRQWQPLMQLEREDGSTVECLATVALEEPMTARVLPRGNWLDESGEVVEPAGPACLPPVEHEGPRATRLDLARWLTRPDHPLTARVVVNRLWHLFLGRGLALPLDDLGAQGGFPSHPELLDRLALELVESGWDLRHVMRQVVTSETYRQSSDRTAATADDPENLMFGRQSRWRLEAEFVRDGALAAAGLLDRRIGGPSFKPYQPEGYWQHLNFPPRRWKASGSEDQWRRGLYVHWQRTFVHPALLALDAPSREETVAQRARSNTPLAALTLLDDPSWVEAAKALAERVREEVPEGDAARLQRLSLLVLQRPFDAGELAVLEELLATERARFAATPEAAEALLTVGLFEVPNGDAPERAAWMQVARAVLNLHEAITRP